MSAHFFPGALALIANQSCQANLGRMVRLIESLGSPAEYTWEGLAFSNPVGGTIWVIEVCGDEPLQTFYDGGAAYGPICEYKLIPLGGDFAPERQKAKEQDHA
ncbi:hypothetical protein [Pseudomonas rhizoryzae]|uniref:hypothetical protein n=1 Tax=Pseudomonas rhizoryzae TaxID=2571129 RepID=UPI0010C1928E|nr:hypothetical protein [Pseudomonas rhizoryzae]